VVDVKAAGLRERVGLAQAWRERFVVRHARDRAAFDDVAADRAPTGMSL